MDQAGSRRRGIVPRGLRRGARVPSHVSSGWLRRSSLSARAFCGAFSLQRSLSDGGFGDVHLRLLRCHRLELHRAPERGWVGEERRRRRVDRAGRHFCRAVRGGGGGCRGGRGWELVLHLAAHEAQRELLPVRHLHPLRPRSVRREWRHAAAEPGRRGRLLLQRHVRLRRHGRLVRRDGAERARGWIGEGHGARDGALRHGRALSHLRTGGGGGGGGGGRGSHWDGGSGHRNGWRSGAVRRDGGRRYRWHGQPLLRLRLLELRLLRRGGSGGGGDSLRLLFPPPPMRNPSAEFSSLRIPERLPCTSLSLALRTPFADSASSPNTASCAPASRTCCMTTYDGSTKRWIFSHRCIAGCTIMGYLRARLTNSS
mmetsp:Transcript_10317/g.33820  ORF Transcript_10317/g.33820 Transcript_10317/m.33820 type:complete len:370 (-) Transcript_10317:571-1680(-)